MFKFLDKIKKKKPNFQKSQTTVYGNCKYKYGSS